MPAVTVRLASRVVKLRARRNSFHDAMKVRSPAAATDGAASGSWTRQSRPRGPSPSSVAASSSSFGSSRNPDGEGEAEGGVGEDERDGRVHEAERAHPFVEREEEEDRREEGHEEEAEEPEVLQPRPHPAERGGGGGGRGEAEERRGEGDPGAVSEVAREGLSLPERADVLGRRRARDPDRGDGRDLGLRLDRRRGLPEGGDEAPRRGERDSEGERGGGDGAAFHSTSLREASRTTTAARTRARSIPWSAIAAPYPKSR